MTNVVSYKKLQNLKLFEMIALYIIKYLYKKSSTVEEIDFQSLQYFYLDWAQKGSPYPVLVPCCGTYLSRSYFANIYLLKQCYKGTHC